MSDRSFSKSRSWNLRYENGRTPFRMSMQQLQDYTRQAAAQAITEKIGTGISRNLISTLRARYPLSQAPTSRRRLNGYLAQRIPSLCFVSTFRSCLNYEVLKCMFPWRTRYPFS